MNEQAQLGTLEPTLEVEHVKEFRSGDLNDLCDATDAAISAGGGFGWLDLPERDSLERYWQGVVTMSLRELFVARLDHVICGACQIIWPCTRNEAQNFHMKVTTHFIAPWARNHGLARSLLEQAETFSRVKGFGVMNFDIRETQTEAMRLYEMMGYRRLGTHPAYARVDGKILSGYYYSKIIDPVLTKAIEQNKK